MTCRLSSLSWLDVLYNSVRKTPGGINDAAEFLTKRRGKSIAAESLRQKLTAHKGEAISVEMGELLTEWMQEKAGGAEYARDWIVTLGAQHGLSVDAEPTQATTALLDELAAIQVKAMAIAAQAGRMCEVTSESVLDGDLDHDERDAIVSILRGLRSLTHRAERTVIRAAGQAKGRAAA